VGLVGLLFLGGRTWIELSRVEEATAAAANGRNGNHDLRSLHLYAAAVKACMLALAVNGAFLSFLYESPIWLALALGGALPHVLRRVDHRAQEAAGAVRAAVRRGPLSVPVPGPIAQPTRPRFRGPRPAPRPAEPPPVSAGLPFRPPA
jgi:hypothetical protein